MVVVGRSRLLFPMKSKYAPSQRNKELIYYVIIHISNVWGLHIFLTQRFLVHKQTSPLSRWLSTPHSYTHAVLPCTTETVKAVIAGTKGWLLFIRECCAINCGRPIAANSQSSSLVMWLRYMWTLPKDNYFHYLLLFSQVKVVSLCQRLTFYTMPYTYKEPYA